MRALKKMNEQIGDYLRRGVDIVTKTLTDQARKGHIYTLSLARKEDWRTSVGLVLESLASYLEVRSEPDVLYPDTGLSPLLSRQIRELHGFSAAPGRGDLIFAKYYRDAVLDYLDKLSFKKDERGKLQGMVLNFFDKLELSFGDISTQPIIIREVIEVERSKRTLDEAEKRLKTILETIPAAAVVVDRKGKIRSLNQEAARLFETSFEESIGRGCHEVVQSHVCGEDCNLKKTYLSGGCFDGETMTVQKAGEKKLSIVASGACLKDYNGQVIGGLEIYIPKTRGATVKTGSTFNDETLQKTIQKIERLSVTDETTELYTKDYFRDRLDKEVKRASRFHHPLSVVLLEADHFELYLRFYGKDEADVLLKIIAGLLNFSVRSIDVVARYGPKQFGLLLLECRKMNAEEIASRVCSGIAAYKFAGQEKLPLGKLTVSIGVASYPDEAKTRQSLLNRAYENMCLAISRGGNQVIS